jgi:UDP-N-acetylmuramate: L-alanyl-gamma-D-glutamyl-meso-diaminopimelate ligase
MNLHLLGICGTFMGGLALLARARGHQVGGSDDNVYPPMSTQLADQGIDLCQGYRAEHLAADCDQVIIGNALSRGNEAVEQVLIKRMNYTSGAQWLGEHILHDRRVLAVAGTHGKTTTAAMVAWILDQAGLAPGFLIGGVPQDFQLSARLGEGEWFVVEADEYDTAFFDKRSKFVHYRPEVAILNNLEFDHADIFPDLAAIQTQFHHLVRTLPGNGCLVVNGADQALDEVLTRGCWTPGVHFGTDKKPGAWWGQTIDASQGRVAVGNGSGQQIQFSWQLSGQHNLANAVAACAAASAAGVSLEDAAAALSSFKSVKRRLEVLANHREIVIYDDFAHHPTAIRETLEGLRQSNPNARIVAVLEPRSNSMRMGAHAEALAPALDGADVIAIMARPELKWDARSQLTALGPRLAVASGPEELLRELAHQVRPGDAVVFMSNGGFDGIPVQFAEWLMATDV